MAIRKKSFNNINSISRTLLKGGKKKTKKLKKKTIIKRKNNKSKLKRKNKMPKKGGAHNHNPDHDFDEKFEEVIKEVKDKLRLIKKELKKENKDFNWNTIRDNYTPLNMDAHLNEVVEHFLLDLIKVGPHDGNNFIFNVREKVIETIENDSFLTEI